jgi:hypothetical protein
MGHGPPRAHPPHPCRARHRPDTASRRPSTHLGKADLINRSLQESRIHCGPGTVHPRCQVRLYGAGRQYAAGTVVFMTRFLG